MGRSIITSYTLHYFCCLLVFVVCYETPVSSARKVIVFDTEEQQTIGNIIGTVSQQPEFYTQVAYYEPAQLRFSFLTEGYPNTHLFHIDDTSGMITTTATLDREKLCLSQSCTLELLIGIYSVSGDYFHVMPVHVRLRDINDHVPTFPQRDITLLIPESSPIGTKYQITHAVDPDRDINSIQSYKLQPEHSPFKLEVSNRSSLGTELSLVLLRELDREKTQRYSLRVLAEDGGTPPLTGLMDISIEVTDINDNRPVFSQDVYSVVIHENSPLSSPIITIKATDADFGANGQLGYTFSYSTMRQYRDQFSINGETGVIGLVKGLDYEVKQRYELVVECSDYGNPPQVSQSVVIVDVEDVNDNRPIIHFNLLSDIPENTELGAFIAHVTVSDLDSNQNGHVLCHLNITDFILERIYGNEFQLRLNTRLDREIIDVINGMITCRDNGTDVLQSHRIFRISVKDVNDHTPAFVQGIYRLQITENCPLNTSILTMTAFDPDPEYGQITYSLHSNNVNDSVFTIHPQSGLITTTGIVDRERNSEHILEITAKDNGLPPLVSTVTVIVIVSDENDNFPAFSQPEFLLKLPENMPPYSEVGHISASDPDYGLSGKVLYELNAGNIYADLFRLDSRSGVIKTKSSFDRETQQTYYLLVNALDRGTPSKTSTATVTIQITDLNDSPPIFLFPTEDDHTINITLPVPRNAILTKVSIFDADVGDSAKVLFALSAGNGDKLFRIHPLNGEISLPEGVDSEEDFRRHLQISVKNPGTDISLDGKLVINFNVRSNGDLLAYSDETSVNNYVIILICILVVGSAIVALVLSVICVVLKRRSRKENVYRTRVGAIKTMMDVEEYVGNHEYSNARLNGEMDLNLNSDSDSSPDYKTVTFDPDHRIDHPDECYNPDTSQSTFSSMKRSQSNISMEEAFIESPAACSSMNGIRKHDRYTAFPVMSPDASDHQINQQTDLDNVISERNSNLRSILYNWMLKNYHPGDTVPPNVSVEAQKILIGFHDYTALSLPEMTSEHGSSDSGHGPSEEDMCYKIAEIESALACQYARARNTSFQYALHPEDSDQAAQDKLESKHVRFTVSTPDVLRHIGYEGAATNIKPEQLSSFRYQTRQTPYLSINKSTSFDPNLKSSLQTDI